MSAPDPALLRARAEAVVARQRFMATLHELQERLAPATIARNAWEDIRDKGEAVAEQTVEFAKARPAVPITAAAGLVALAVRKPVFRALGRLFKRKPITGAGVPAAIDTETISGA